MKGTSGSVGPLVFIIKMNAHKYSAIVSSPIPVCSLQLGQRCRLFPWLHRRVGLTIHRGGRPGPVVAEGLRGGRARSPYDAGLPRKFVGLVWYGVSGSTLVVVGRGHQ